MLRRGAQACALVGLLWGGLVAPSQAHAAPAAPVSNPPSVSNPTSVPAADGLLLDEVVAVVDARSVLLSELEVEARLARARQEGPQALLQKPDAAQLKAALAQLVDRLVLFSEAERLQVFDLTQAEVTRGVEDLREKLGKDALERFSQLFDVDEQSVREIVRRELRVERYLEGRFRQAARPKDGEVLKHFQAHRDEYPEQTFEQAQAAVRLDLARARFEQLSSSFVADVRKRAKVRVLRDFDQPGQATPLSGSARAADGAGRQGG